MRFLTPTRVVTLVAAVLVTGCSTLNISLPPITDQPTGASNTGRIIWHDLLTNDIAASRAFYGELFGWEFEELPLSLGFGRSSQYLLIRNKGRLIGGMADTSGIERDGNTSQWIAMMSVADIETAVAQLTRAGGGVLTPPTDLNERGTVAVVKDPSGAVFALLQTRYGDPADLPDRAGDFFWDEVWTDDIAGATSFYSALAPFETVDRELSNGRYQALALSGTPRFGLLQDPIPDLPPTWAPYIKVDDMSVLDKVASAGGSVALPAEKRELGGEVALVIGPSGAGVVLQTWPDDR